MYVTVVFSLFFLNDTPPTEIYTLSLHDALPILIPERIVAGGPDDPIIAASVVRLPGLFLGQKGQGFMYRVFIHPSIHGPDRKSTRLNSSHLGISYAVFCLKKKNKEK